MASIVSITQANTHSIRITLSDKTVIDAIACGGTSNEDNRKRAQVVIEAATHTEFKAK